MHAYTTPQEWLDYPSDLSAEDLVIGASGPATAAAQTAELQRMIARASNTVDQTVYQPLYAHVVPAETISSRPDPYSRLRVRCRHFPLLSVQSAQWRQSSSQPWTPITPASITVYGLLDQGHHYVADNFLYGQYGGWGLPPLTVQSTYVAGYPNAALTQASAAGATTLTVDDATGILAGSGDPNTTTCTVYDSAQTETVTVASVTDNSLTLAAPTAFAHGVGVRVSVLPEAVTLATILIVNALVKGRRAGGGITMAGKLQPSGLDSQEWQDALAILQPFRRVV